MAAILGIFFGTCQLLQSTILAERATDKTRGFAMGLFTTSLYAGSGIGPAVFAPLAPAYGFDVVYRLAAVLILLTLAVFSFMARRKHFS
jgi:MFS family permease